MLHYRLQERDMVIYIYFFYQIKEGKPQIIEKLVWHKRIFTHIQD